jgi:hypothetical protein
MRRFLSALCLGLSLIVAAPASSREPDAPVPSPPVSLDHAKVYVYLFIDQIEDAMGDSLLTGIENELIAQLRARQVEVEFVRFRDTPTGRRFSLSPSNDPPLQHHTWFESSAVVRLPIEKVIAANADKEKAFGAQYRLVVIPASLWNNNSFTIRWVLLGVDRQEPIWWTAAGEEIGWNFDSENSKIRALMEHFFSKAAAAGLF